MAMTDWIWGVDDDEIPEPDVLHILLSDAVVGMNVGAVGGLVLSPNPAPVPDNAKSVITDPNQTIQWFRHPTQATSRGGSLALHLFVSARAREVQSFS